MFYDLEGLFFPCHVTISSAVSLKPSDRLSDTEHLSVICEHESFTLNEHSIKAACQ